MTSTLHTVHREYSDRVRNQQHAVQHAVLLTNQQKRNQQHAVQHAVLLTNQQKRNQQHVVQHAVQVINKPIHTR